MKLASTIIIYHPTEQVILNIHSWLSYVNVLYVFDNTETSMPALVTALKKIPKIKYFNDGKNAGIATRLNEAINYSKNDGYNWLLTMDQDSYFEDGFFNSYKNCFESKSDDTTIAVFGIDYQKKVVAVDDCFLIYVNHLITSGSIINVSVAETIGCFKEDYFIDFVDIEYCFRAIKMGFRVVKVNNIYLTHNLGEIKYYRSLLTLKITERVFHSPLRIYYMLRNFLLVKKAYKNEFSADIKYFKKAIYTSIKNNFLYCNHRYALVKYIIRAWRDYKNNKLGKYLK